MKTTYFLGIDIAKKTFQAALTMDGINMAETEIENTPDAVTNYFKSLQQNIDLSKVVVCMEHTGIYCNVLLDYLHKNNISVWLEHALQIKQSQGMKRGKNDKVDAVRIAQYAFRYQDEIKLWKPQRTSLQKVKALLIVRERLVKTKGQLEVSLSEMRGFVDETIKKSIFKSCKSTVSTNEFTRISDAKKFACYVGIAPFEHSSGTSVRGKTRVSKMANMTIKKLLHMGAMSAIQCNAELRCYYERKTTSGKNKMSVLNAVLNKLITRVFACINNDRLYENKFQNAIA